MTDERTDEERGAEFSRLADAAVLDAVQKHTADLRQAVQELQETVRLHEERIALLEGRAK